jgi:acyl-CoA thioester hydrolase
MTKLSCDLGAEVRLTIPFQDADPMGVTWHGNYFRYMESARSALLDRIGYNYREMSESGYLWPIVDVRVKYVRPTRFGQEIVVRATLVEYENRLKIRYAVYDAASKEQVLKAHTIQVAVDMECNEMCYCSPDALTSKVLKCVRSS